MWTVCELLHKHNIWCCPALIHPHRLHLCTPCRPDTEATARNLLKPPENSWNLLKTPEAAAWTVLEASGASYRRPPVSRINLAGCIRRDRETNKSGSPVLFFKVFFLPPSQLTWHWVTQTDLLLLTAAIMRRSWDADKGEESAVEQREVSRFYTSRVWQVFIAFFFFASVTHMHDKCIRIARSNAVPRFHVEVTDTLPCLIQIEKSYCDAPANRNAIR